MARSQILLLALLALCYSAVAQMNSCTVDGDCGDATTPRGVCVNGFCSCKSGFGGPSCATRPAATCTFPAVSSTGSSFSATPTLTYSHPDLTLQVDVNLEESSFLYPAVNDSANAIPYSAETTITFGSGAAHPNCSFPNGGIWGILWNDAAASSGNCFDRYTVTLPWTDAKSLCGFDDIDGDRTYEQTVTVSRKYILDDLRGQTITRIDSSTHVLKIVFPTEVTVGTSSVQVTGAPDLLAAFSFLDFDPDVSEWTIKFRTSIQAPFKLVNPVINSITGLLETNSRYKTNSLALTSISACNNNTHDCFQEGTLNFVQGTAVSACDALTGSVEMIFGLACQEGAGASCPLTGSETVTLTVNLATGNACPAVDNIDFDVTTLSAFSDAATAQPKTSFITNQVAYFGAVVTSSNAQVLSRNVKANSVCFQIGAGTCQPVQFTQLAASGGHDPVFSVDFSANSGVFGSLDAGAASAQFFQVKAVIDVTFVGGTSKRSLEMESSHSMAGRDVQFSKSLGLRTGIDITPSNPFDDMFGDGSSAASLPISFSLLLALVLAAMM